MVLRDTKFASSPVKLRLVPPGDNGGRTIEGLVSAGSKSDFPD